MSVLQSLFWMFLAGFAGAFAHYIKSNLGSVTAVNTANIKMEALGFWAWLISKSPWKSLSVWILLAGGLLLLTLLGLTASLLGLLTAALYGYFLDSLMKRHPGR